jgi:hypothetical protein
LFEPWEELFEFAGTTQQELMQMLALWYTTAAVEVAQMLCAAAQQIVIALKDDHLGNMIGEHPSGSQARNARPDHECGSCRRGIRHHSVPL